MRQLYVRIFLLLGCFLLIGIFFAFDLQQYLTLEHLKSHHTFYKQYYAQNPTLTLLIYFVFLLTLTALSIPGLSIVILAAASIFGFPVTLVVTSFADVFGSILAFLGSRYLFGKKLQDRHPIRLQAVNQGIAKEGALYLLSLRLIPLFPCFLINLLMGLTKIPVTTFYWATQLGKLPHNAIYANAGTQISKSDSLLGIFSPEVVISFLLIGAFPLFAKKGLRWAKVRKANYFPQETQQPCAEYRQDSFQIVEHSGEWRKWGE
ncbi:MAG: TVP38/TMEM64 family protein [Deltaproteobacteria bacterium]|nr:TVP38/TMEM64 family protein [Deltaproteobacteria bacterium]